MLIEKPYPTIDQNAYNKNNIIHLSWQSERMSNQPTTITTEDALEQGT